MPVAIKVDLQQGLTITCSRQKGITVQSEEQKKSILLLEEHGFLKPLSFLEILREAEHAKQPGLAQNYRNGN